MAGLKFADLVRNFSQTNGEADFVLTGAVRGYASFTDELVVGDSFYYAAVSTDKPDEREVGTGTLLAGGVIQRDPLNGVKTVFSPGVKSVSLVSPAAWLATLEALRAGGPYAQLDAAMLAANNLADVEDVATARTNLMIGSVASYDVSQFAVTVPDRATMAVWNATNVVYFDGNMWDRMAGTNYASEVAVDTLQGVYVPLSGDASGTGGAWVRRTLIVTPFMFTAVGDAVADDAAALTAFNAYVFSKVRTQLADWTINAGVLSKVFIGPTADPSQIGPHYHVSGDLRIKALGALTEISELQNLDRTIWSGRISSIGVGTGPYNTRTCGVAIRVTNCQNFMLSGGLRAYHTQYHGIWIGSTGTLFNDCMTLGGIMCSYCGSGPIGTNQALSANWTTPVNHGTSGSAFQYTTLSVTTLPPVIVDSYESWAEKTVLAVINGEPYVVESIDRVASTINIYRWLDSAVLALGSGTLDYIFGAGYQTKGGDSGIISVGHAEILNCGIALGDGALYGSRFGSANLEANGLNMAIGLSGNAHIGTSADALYMEASNFDIILFAPTGTGYANYILSTYNVDLDKCWALQDSRQTDDSWGNFGGAFGTPNAIILGVAGQFHRYVQRPTNNGTSTIGLAAAKPPEPTFYNLDSATLNISNTSDGLRNTQFGYVANIVWFLGSGPGAAPTGSFTVNPPTTTRGGVQTISGNDTVTLKLLGLGSRGLRVGMPVSGTGIPAGATVLTIVDRTHVQLSAAATATSGVNGVTLTFTGSVNVAGAGNVFGPVTLSGFDGPLGLLSQFTDRYENRWTVNVISGRGRVGYTPIGYATGVALGNAAVQATSRTTAVTMNKISGKITLFNTSTTAGQLTSFTLNNSQLGANDTLSWTQLAGAGVYFVSAKNNGNGTATVSVYTPAAVAAEAPAFQYNIIKGTQT